MLTLNGFVQAKRVGPIEGKFSAGQLTLLIGPNGSGKSSLLLGAAGLSDSEGATKVRLADKELSHFSLPELARQRAMLTQQSHLPLGLRGYELLALGAEQLGGVTHKVCLAMARLAEPLGLEALYHRALNTLSGGEQQRLLIASTLLQVDPTINSNAKLLLLDEPLAGLDWQHQLATLALLRQYADAGLAVVASIHDINLACQYADEVWCLHQGKLVARGAPSIITPALIAEVFKVKVRLIMQENIRVMVPEEPKNLDLA